MALLREHHLGRAQDPIFASSRVLCWHYILSLWSSGGLFLNDTLGKRRNSGTNLVVIFLEVSYILFHFFLQLLFRIYTGFTSRLDTHGDSTLGLLKDQSVS